MKFTFAEFNERRRLRGAPAARVDIVDDDGGIGWLWMSERDIRANLREFGEDAELRKALYAYNPALARGTALHEAMAADIPLIDPATVAAQLVADYSKDVPDA